MKLKWLFVLLALTLVCLKSSAQATKPLDTSVQINPTTNLVSIRVVNMSHKPVNDFELQITYFAADGKADVGYSAELLPSSDPLEPGAEMILERAAYQPGAKVVVSADVVLYTDGTTYVTNQFRYRSIVATKKGKILGLQKANELLAAALADPKDQHPTATVISQLKALDTAIRSKGLAVDDPENWEAQGFNVTLTNLGNAPVSPIGRTPAEEQFLRDLIQHNQIHAAAIVLPKGEGQ